MTCLSPEYYVEHAKIQFILRMHASIWSGIIPSFLKDEWSMCFCWRCFFHVIIKWLAIPWASWSVSRWVGRIFFIFWLNFFVLLLVGQICDFWRSHSSWMLNTKLYSSIAVLVLVRAPLEANRSGWLKLYKPTQGWFTLSVLERHSCPWLPRVYSPGEIEACAFVTHDVLHTMFSL